jgi:hypothetical protein
MASCQASPTAGLSPSELGKRAPGPDPALPSLGPLDAEEPDLAPIHPQQRPFEQMPGRRRPHPSEQGELRHPPDDGVTRARSNKDPEANESPLPQSVDSDPEDRT